jgi:hypothetical protein
MEHMDMVVEAMLVAYTLILLLTILRIETRVPPSVRDAQAGFLYCDENRK